MWPCPSASNCFARRPIAGIPSELNVGDEEWLYLPTLGGSFLGGGVTVTTTDTYDTRGDGSFATTLVTPAQTQVAANRRIDPDRHQPFIDELLLGYRRQLPGRVSVDATFIRRAYKDMPAQIDVNGIYTGGVFRGYEDVSQNAILLQTNNVEYADLHGGGGRRISAHAPLAVRRRVHARHLDGTWQPNEPASFIQPTVFANNRGIGTIRGNENNSLSGTAQARNPMWIKHALRLAGSYNAPWGLTLSSNLNIFSGPYTGPIVRDLSAPDPQFGPAILVLSNGRSVESTGDDRAFRVRQPRRRAASGSNPGAMERASRSAVRARQPQVRDRSQSLEHHQPRRAARVPRRRRPEYGKQSDRQPEFRVRARRHVPRPESPGRSHRSVVAAVRVLDSSKECAAYGRRAYSARACLRTGRSGSALFHSVKRSL